MLRKREKSPTNKEKNFEKISKTCINFSKNGKSKPKSELNRNKNSFKKVRNLDNGKCNRASKGSKVNMVKIKW